MDGGEFTGWVADFEAAAVRRRADGDPDWGRGAGLDAAVVRSLQLFQLGESGDGANLAVKAAGCGDRSYAAAVRLFIAEEQNHARLLARLLAGTVCVVVFGHGTALTRFGVPRRRFAADVLRGFRAAVTGICCGDPALVAGPSGEPDPADREPAIGVPQ